MERDTRGNYEVSCQGPVLDAAVRWRGAGIRGWLLTAALSLGSAYATGTECPEFLHQTPVFREVAQESGLRYTHVSGMTGQYYFPEINGSGVGLLDYDQDGDLDVYLVQGGLVVPKPGDPPLPGDRLFRNELQVLPDGTRKLGFTDVTEASGIQAIDYGMGVTVGDYDNDGWPDLYLSNYGKNRLYRNLRNGRFEEVVEQAGVQDSRWSASASFLDLDRDGWLDLYVGNYVDFSPSTHKRCTAGTSAQDYCSPQAYEPVPDRLFRNLGNGRFEDISSRSGIVQHYGAALGAVSADFNGDHWPDLYVANDGMANQLWLNQQDGRLTDDALMAGVAVNRNGMPEASMGVDSADIDGDGDEDLIMTHLVGETNTLYLNDGKGWFQDRSAESGLGLASRSFTAFGTAWLDFDNDTRLDLLVVNGAVTTVPQLAEKADPLPFHQPNQLFWNAGDARFTEVSACAGDVFTKSEVSRGAAFGDLDNDGDTDVVINNNSARAGLYLNEIGNRQHWLGLRLIGAGGRDMLGARVAILRSDGLPPLWRRARSDGSYASANDPRVLVGLGKHNKIQGLRVIWPDGSQEEWGPLTLDRYHTLVLGKGTAYTGDGE